MNISKARDVADAAQQMTRNEFAAAITLRSAMDCLTPSCVRRHYRFVQVNNGTGWHGHDCQSEAHAEWLVGILRAATVQFLVKRSPGTVRRFVGDWV